MKPADRAVFVKTLNLAYAALLKPLPPLDVLQLWETLLEPYTIDQVTHALSQHMRESKFPPVPADVISRINARIDTRPGADEAWTIAVRAMDERETVVMNNEIAEALSGARDVFETGDEVGARMAFREIYNRVVARARADGVAVAWWPSLGTNRDLRREAIQKAVADGRLSEHAPVVRESLAAPIDPVALLAAPAQSEAAREAIEGLRSFLTRGTEDAAALREKRLQAERDAVAARKAELRAQAEGLGLTGEGFENVILLRSNTND